MPCGKITLLIIDHHRYRGKEENEKNGRVAIYVLVVIIFFLTIPEVVVRVLTPKQFARLSDFTSFGGLFSSILMGVLAIFVTTKIYRHVTRYKS